MGMRMSSHMMCPVPCPWPRSVFNMHCIRSVRTKSSTPDFLMKTSVVKTEVVEARGDVMRGLEQGTTKAVDLK